MPIQFDLRNGIGLVTCAEDSLDPFGGGPDTQERFEAWFSGMSEVTNIVIDLSAVRWLHEDALDNLFIMLKRVSARGGDLFLAQPQPAIRSILELTRLHNVFRICDSMEAALALAVAPKAPQPEAAPLVRPPAPPACPAKPPTTESTTQWRTPAPEEFRLACELREGIWVLAPSCSLHAGISALFRQQFDAWLAGAPGVKHLVLDCAAVEWFDESGLGLLIRPVKQLQRQGGRAVLACVHPCARRLIQHLRMVPFFRICDTVEEALQVVRTEPQRERLTPSCEANTPPTGAGESR